MHLLAARRLLPIEEIIAVQCEPEPEVALWVDDYTLALRMSALDWREREMLAEADGDDWRIA